MIRLIMNFFRRGSRLYPGVVSAISSDGRRVNIDDTRFNLSVATMLDRAERTALGMEPYARFTIELTPTEVALYNEDDAKFTAITNLQLISHGLMVSLIILGYDPGPPARLQFMRNAG